MGMLKKKDMKEIDEEIRLGDLIKYIVKRRCASGISFAELSNTIYLISTMLEKHDIFIDCGRFRNYRNGMISEEIANEIALLRQANYIESELKEQPNPSPSELLYPGHRAENFDANKFLESLGPIGKDIDKILDDKKIWKDHKKVSHLVDAKHFVSQIELPKYMKTENVIKIVLEERGYGKEELRGIQDLLKTIETYKL
jgi:hypothetical protein